MKQKKHGEFLRKKLFLVCMVLCCLFGMASTASAKTVAKIGSKSYSSLPAAVKAVKKGQTIKLYSNIDMKKKTLKLNKNVKYTIDLNKKTISNLKDIKLTKGNVTIKNGTIKIKVINNYKYMASTYLSSNTTLNLSGVSYSGSFSVYQGAKLIVKSGTYKNTYLYNDGYTAISGGTFKSLYHIANEGSLYITKGTFKILGAEDSDMMIVNGAKYNDANIYVKGGEFSFESGSYGSIEVIGGHLYVISSLYDQFKKYLNTCTGWFCCLNSTTWGSWSDWSTTPMTANATTQVETKTEYRYSDLQTTSSYSSSMSGWTQTGSSVVYGSYGNWSSWDINYIAGSDTREVQTSTVYYYCYNQCPYCGAHMHVSTGCYTWAGGCGRSDIGNHWVTMYSTTPYSSTYEFHGTGHYAIDSLPGGRWFKVMSTNPTPCQGYQYRDRSKSTLYYYSKWDDWSAWGNTYYSASSTRKVESRTLYRKRTK